MGLPPREKAVAMYTTQGYGQNISSVFTVVFLGCCV
jgi:hypothetical protein